MSAEVFLTLFQYKAQKALTSYVNASLSEVGKSCFKSSFKLKLWIPIFFFQKWFSDNMGQVDSKRPMPSIQVQSLHTAHLPEKPRTPTPSKALLNVPKQHIR